MPLSRSVVAVSFAIALFGSRTEAAVKTAATPAFDDVEAAVTTAVDHDTVVIPPGTAVWTKSLTVDKAITLQGSGVGQTIIVEQLPSDQPLIPVETVAGKSYRITGIEFRNGTRTSRFQTGIITLRGSSSSVRIDNCKFYRLRNICVRVGGYVRGVVDHNDFTADDDSQFIWIKHPDWAGGKWGDKSWSEPLDWGGPDAFYIEDNTFTGEGLIATVTDAYAGARFVCRHNRLHNGTVASHGTESTGRYRGLRHFEIYNNVWSADPPTAKNAIRIRGGTGVVFSNVVESGLSKLLTLSTYRLAEHFAKFGGADGVTLWDKNDPAGVFLSGAAGPGSGDKTLVVPGAGWQPDQWRGYTVYVPSSSLHPKGFFHSGIIGNTSDTITVAKGTFTAAKPFVEGERFEIRRVLLPLDGSGIGTCDYLVDQSADPVPVFLNQILDPVYVWGNEGSSLREHVSADAPPIVEGVHFHSGIPRPGYVPYVYPHPLIQGTPSQSQAPSSPSGIRIVAGQ